MSSASKPAFFDKQYELTAHIRDPLKNNPPSDIEDRRLAIYRDLFFNNVQSFLENSFPVLRELYGEDNWLILMREYFSTHQAHTPLFSQMPQEFLKFIQAREPQKNDPIFLNELAHYEWVELAIMIDQREYDEHHIESSSDDLLESVPFLSPVAWPLVYQFPVHTIGPDYQPETVPEQPTYLIVYRDAKDEVHFMELNPVTARLIELIKQSSGKNGRTLLLQIADELNHQDPEMVVQNGLGILEDLKRRNII